MRAETGAHTLTCYAALFFTLKLRFLKLLRLTWAKFSEVGRGQVTGAPEPSATCLHPQVEHLPLPTHGSQRLRFNQGNRLRTRGKRQLQHVTFSLQFSPSFPSTFTCFFFI